MANNWRISETIRATGNIVQRGIERYADIVKEEVNRNAPGSVPDFTKVQPTLRGVKVINDHPAISFLTFGTPPHEITPRTKQVLRWIDEATGEPRFAKLVRHPGTDPNPFFINGVIRAKFKAREAF